MYEVDNKPFDSYFAAVTAASALRVNVEEVRPNGERITRWTPPPQKSKRRVRHEIVNADGTVTPFSKVRR